MSGLEVPAFLIGVASLLDVEIIMLKLDIEKTRLLVCGNEIGIFTANQQHSGFMMRGLLHYSREF
jgi:hypothetical protein